MHGSQVARASPICEPLPFVHEHNTALLALEFTLHKHAWATSFVHQVVIQDDNGVWFDPVCRTSRVSARAAGIDGGLGTGGGDW